MVGIKKAPLKLLLAAQSSGKSVVGGEPQTATETTPHFYCVLLRFTAPVDKMSYAHE